MKKSYSLQSSISLFTTGALLLGCIAASEASATEPLKKNEAPVLPMTMQSPQVDLESAMTEDLAASLEKLYELVPEMKDREVKPGFEANGIMSLELADKGEGDYARINVRKSSGVITSYQWYAYLNEGYKSDNVPGTEAAVEAADVFLRYMFGDWADNYQIDQVKGARSPVILDQDGNPLKITAFITVNFLRVMDGTVNKNDRVSVEINEQGRVIGYSHTVINEIL